MATKFWTGATSTAFDVAANWSPAIAPTEGDDLIFGDQATANCAGSDESATGIFASISVVKGFESYTIGSAATSLKVQCTNVTIDAPGSSKSGMHIEGGTTGSTNIKNLWVRNCGFASITGEIHFIQVSRGKVTFEAGLAMDAGDTFIVTYVNNRSDASVTIAAGATLPTTTEVEVYGGKINNSADITTLNCRNAQWTNTTGDITTLRLQSGDFTWTDGDITTCEVGPAKLVGSQSDAARTITTLKMLHPRCGIDFNDGAGNISVTNPIIYEGGEIKIASNQTLDIDT